MTHGDDTGLICPPRLAPVQVVVVPIWKTDTERQAVFQTAHGARDMLAAAGLRTTLDERDMKPGAKYYEWEARGVPIRLEIGPRDVSQGQVILARRTGGKVPIKLADLLPSVRGALDTMQYSLLEAARARREQNSKRGVTREQLIEMMEGPGGFAYGGFCGSGDCEAQIKDKTKATIRVLPDPEFRSSPQPKTCLWCGQPATAEAVWARAY